MKKILSLAAALALGFTAYAEGTAQTVTLDVQNATDITGTEVPERPAGTNSETDNGEARHIQPLESLKIDGYSFTFTSPESGTQAAYYYPMSTNTSGTKTLRLYGGCGMTITAPQGTVMTKIVMKGTNAKKLNDATVNTGTVTATSATSGPLTWTAEANAAANAVTFSFAGPYRPTTMEITYEATTQEFSQAPVFSPESCTFSEPLEVSISAADGAAIYYTTDGTTPTAESTAYTAPFSVTETTTVKAIAVEEGKAASNVATATYTFEQVYNYLAALMAAGLEDTNTAVKFGGEATVTYQNGNKLYLQDRSGALLAFGKLSKTYNPGDVLTGFSGKMTTYKGLYELNVNADSFGDAISNEGAPEPAYVELADVTDAMQNYYIQLKGVSISDISGKNFKIAQGETTVAGYNSFSGVTLPEATDKQYDIVGIVGVFSSDDIVDLSDLQINPISFTEVVAPTPTALDWTPTPADGATVETLEKVDFAYSEDKYSSIDGLSTSDVKVLKDNVEFCGVNYVDNYNGTVTFKFKTPATEAGVYTLNIPADVLEIWDAAMTSSFQNAAMTYSWTVTGAVAPEGLDWTPDPENGATVDTLETVTFAYNTEKYDSIDGSDTSSIKVLKDNVEFCDVNYTDYGSGKAVIKFKTPAVEAGVYTLNIPAGAFEVWNKDYSSFMSEAMTYSWTVTGSAAPEKLQITADPADGATVESLASVTLTYEEGKYDELEVASTSGINLYMGEELVSEITSEAITNGVRINFKTVPTRNGEYTLKIDEYALAGWIYGSEDATEIDNTEAITYHYTLNIPDAEFEYSVTPESGSTVKQIEEMAFSCYNGAVTNVDVTDGFTVTKDGAAADNALFTVTYDKDTNNNFVIKLNTPITEPGTYVLSKTGAIQYTSGEAKTANIEVTYTVPEPAAPVVYDVVPTGSRPADGSSIDLSEKALTAIFIDVPSGIKAGEGATLTMTGAGEYNKTANLMFSFDTRLWAEIAEPGYNGNYTITIPEGSFGDADWMNDHATGHANPEIVINFTVVGCSKGVVFDLEPVSYTPTADTESLAKITMTFAEDVQVNTGNRATLADAEGNYYERLLFTVSAEDAKTVECEPDPVPEADVTYRLTVPAGTFGTAEFISSNGGDGHANPEFTLDWTKSGVSIVGAEEKDARYYNLQGQSIKTPAPGSVVIRVVNGKATKLIVR